jgi:putative transposase
LSVKGNRAYRYELDPRAGQSAFCWPKHAGAARFPYNWGLARGIELFQETGKSPHAIKEHRELSRLKKRVYPWLYEVSKHALQEAFRDLERAVGNFFPGPAGRREGGCSLVLEERMGSPVPPDGGYLGGGD